MKSKLLTDLKKTLKEEAIQAPRPAAKAPVAKPTPADDGLSDEELFARASQGAKRVSYDGLTPGSTRPKRPDAQTLARRALAEGGPEGPIEGLSDTAALLNPIGVEAALEFARSGIQQKVMKKLKQGLMPWQAAVDLHGCTLDEAREAVGQLVSEARRDGLQVIKIVHGKGTQSGHPLLKTCVNSWLQQLQGVLAFVSALPRDGGTGAVYVLLKKQGTPIEPGSGA